MALDATVTVSLPFAITSPVAARPTTDPPIVYAGVHATETPLTPALPTVPLPPFTTQTAPTGCVLTVTA